MRSQQIEEVAAEWLSKRDSGNWSEADEAQLAQWLEHSPANKVEYLRLRRSWNQANKLRALGAGVDANEIPPRGQWRLQTFPVPDSVPAARADSRPDVDEGVAPPPSNATKSARGKWFGLAASVVMALAGTTGWWLMRQGQESYATAIGRIERVPLADGSQVTLNTSSKVQVTLTDTQRRIDLREGEAFFEVAKDASRPFVVYAGDQRVIAVGTKFSVWRTGASARVVVVEGRVRVDTVAEDPRGAHATELGAGEVARADAMGVTVAAPKLNEAEANLAWRSGFLNFRDTSLSEAVAEFNRYNERKLVIADPSIAQLRIGANLRMNNIAAFVRVLEQEFAIQASDQGERILLSAAKDSR
ncbi:FecR family protein [Steroidobacter sp.]|uniref:FecR family protein n=1 Tax=Steroidobacter sp. TaxID=1978227 RepID=UPI001A53B47B|nr:FecR domain-containing protein [Steroidobacter sp.]MBL8266801.1 FecR domain-containing protein [Steroidobacter sp.]